MNRIIGPAAALAALLATSAASAAPTPPAHQAGKEASIPFANHGGIYDWDAAGRDTLYIEDRSHRWYKAQLLTPCIDLPFAEGIGFASNPDGSFDRFSNVIVRGQRCPVASLVRSDPPPKRTRKPAH